MATRLVLALLASGCASAVPTESSTSYLALGDSIAFGYDPLVDLNRDQVRGYPELLAERRGLDITNLSCPGEASGGFMSTTGADNHCRENRQAYPLHVDYEGTQLRAAVEFLEASPDTSLVTIDLGANDVFLLDHKCNRDIACILAELVATTEAYSRNLDFIFTELRHVYDGPIVGLSVYNPYPADATAQYALDRINVLFADHLDAKGGVLADGMTAFTNASNGDPCANGLLIEMPDGTCDVHPTPAGAKVLADAIDTALAK
ncbi:MAG: SGNH/GDSL hydrolase family protein [Deltaproteobacteria bacterium]|nr:SGNH/GDSL hydrolase family protein [Deltaproteobacteria bacterium]